MTDSGAVVSGSVVSASTQAWCSSLVKMAGQLSATSKAAGTEFRELGITLRGFSSACTDNSSMAANLVTAIESGGGFNVTSLKSLFGKVYTEIDISSKLILEGSKEMNLIIGDLNKVVNMEDFFRKLSKTITIIGTLIRIETARVGNAEFNIMTELVDTLANQILQGTDDIITSVRTANVCIKDANEHLSPFIRTAEMELNSVKNRVNIIIGELELMSSQARSLCDRISTRAASISAEVGAITVSMKMYEVTRRRIGHVCEALHDIEAIVSTLDSKDAEDKFVLTKWISEAIEIQIKQLYAILSETHDASVNVSGSLSKVSDLSEAQAEDAATITEEEASGRNKITLVGLALDALVKVLTAVNDMTVSLLDSIKLTSTNIQGMTGHVANVESISDNMNLMAMNAMIKVSRVGEAGRGLGVLADEISKLSETTNIRIAECAGLINSILNRSSRIKTYLSGELNSRLETSRVVAEQTFTAIETLMRQDKEVISSMNAISSIATSLKMDIDNVLRRINFSSIIEHTVNEVLTALLGILDEITDTISGHERQYVNYTADLKGMLNRYVKYLEIELLAGSLSGEPK
ncbi:MAG: methyl-accepting chemotaxis protein [Candidatus Magnetominusculus sp. LBB02]|nr:methyl-accepting chemotaxis protein [Candidatus Magnetominusculus sp. LBB02]